MTLINSFPCAPLKWICSVCCNHNSVLSSFMTYHWVCNKSNTTSVTCGPVRSTLSSPPLLVGSCGSILYFLCIVLQIIVCPFSFSYSILCPLLYMASDYSFGILKFLSHLQMSLVEEELLTFPGFFYLSCCSCSQITFLVVMSTAISTQKLYSVLHNFHLCCRWFMSYLCYLSNTICISDDVRVI